eukprot:CAMPEP_0167752410 /NCGR_PEP_ID=MMETSP0110_2-20121227/7125_1 /TAXON_ID=629695 /ORGANISM="Gymnochlora sp., Strain CCMP2014" /LENGTH=303 /DNA_ID=CAMNT_0007638027 /DNA_START=96 /DNA_END=1007 /DNA_ORIENTATION=+
MDGHDKTLKFVQYASKVLLLIGKSYNHVEIPVALIRLNHLYTVLRSARFVYRLGFWINALSRVTTHFRTGAYRSLSPDSYERFFEVLDMAETWIQLFEGLLQDFVILSMFHALDPEINRKWRPLMNILWMICLKLNGLMMARNYLERKRVIERAKSSPDLTETDKQKAQEISFSFQASSADNSMLKLEKKENIIPLSPMSRPVKVITHCSERRSGIFNPDYGTPSDRQSVVSHKETNARRISSHELPEILCGLIKYTGDFAYCYGDTMQVFGRDGTSIQWIKATGALTSAILAIHSRWTKMFP